MPGKEILKGKGFSFMNEKELSFDDVSRILNKSKRTISRYIKAGKLNPKKIKGKKGILEYSFNRSEVEGLKNSEVAGQGTGHNQKVDNKYNDILSLLKDNMKVLQKQLKIKDQEIKKLNQRLDRQEETNRMIGQIQTKLLLLEDKTKDKKQMTKDMTKDMTQANKWHIKNIINKIFKRKGDT